MYRYELTPWVDGWALFLERPRWIFKGGGVPSSLWGWSERWLRVQKKVTKKRVKLRLRREQMKREGILIKNEQNNCMQTKKACTELYLCSVSFNLKISRRKISRKQVVSLSPWPLFLCVMWFCCNPILLIFPRQMDSDPRRADPKLSNRVHLKLDSQSPSHKVAYVFTAYCVKFSLLFFSFLPSFHFFLFVTPQGYHSPEGTGGPTRGR